MRALTEEENKIVFEKLTKFIGKNLVNLVGNEHDPHVFRINKERVYYVSARVCKYAGCVPKKQLISLGTCLGKFSKTKKFNLKITCLRWLSLYAINKIWLKPAGEQVFLYGNHVVKRHLAKVTENTSKNVGVIILSMNDIPLGFGVTSRSTNEMRLADNEAVVAFHQGDIGEYLRDECDLL
ncbi:uncharacterized protein LOC128884280 [Hylaeus volcanicus]|uniref:uncharacterized protein LOC128884280 n=1 Tax=Hylaeus volcanicus TaxID=313075 RepID=UPI0023B79DFA|nr:uncharacterized protein LOC128884280 [Hylaeus volcanicus]